MSDPYRESLEKDSSLTSAVCKWCKYSNRGPWIYNDKKCEFGCTKEAIVDIQPINGKRTLVNVILCNKKNKNGKCQDYEPSLITRIAWWRKLP